MEDRITIIVEGETALKVVEKLGVVLQDLLTRQSYRGSGGGKGTDRGIFRTVPVLTDMASGDTLSVPVSAYHYDTKWKRIKFFSPFAPDGELSATGMGAQTTGIDPSGKMWEKLFPNGWEFDQTGASKTFPLRLAKLKVGVDKEDPEKKFVFIVKLENPETTDPTAITYVEQVVAPQHNGGSHAQASHAATTEGDPATE